MYKALRSTTGRAQAHASSSTMSRLAPDLPDEVVEEILLRIPPDEPGCMVRASSVSKPWRRHLSSPTFRRIYRDFHRAPPMLGFFHNTYDDDHNSIARFVSSTHMSPINPDIRNFTVHDCRHGRVLLEAQGSSALVVWDPKTLVVWDPMTGSRRELQTPDCDLGGRSIDRIAVLCALGGDCDHLSCHEGPFLVVYVGVDCERRVASAFVYSSDTGSWSAPTSELNHFVLNIDGPGVLVGDALHFLCFGRNGSNRILKYDLSRHCLSLINFPAAAPDFPCRFILLVAPEDGRLGFALVKSFTIPRTLYIWSRDVQDGSVDAWTQPRVIDLETLLPIGDPMTRIFLNGSVEGTEIIFAMTNDYPRLAYEIDLKSLWTRKLYEGEHVTAFLPLSSFYNPLGRRDRSSTLAPVKC